MKKSILFAGLMMVAAMFIGCDKDHSPQTSTSKLWPAATVSKNADGIEVEKWGFIDEKGNFVIGAAYEAVNSFSCGYALVQVNGGSIFFIDEKNNMQNAPEFIAVDPFFYYDHVGYKTSGKLWGMLDRNFETVIQPAYAFLGYMSDAGLVVARQSGADKYGYLDKKGDLVIPANFEDADQFEAGYAVVRMGSTSGVIDTKGNYSISLQDKPLQNLGQERIGFADPTTWKGGFMDVKGNVIVQAMYDNYSKYGFTDVDLLAVKQSDKWGFMDKNGKVVIGLQFYAASPFMNGYAWVKRAETSNYECIDEKGKSIFSLGENEVPDGMFRQGLCLVRKLESDGVSFKYVNEKGGLVYTWKLSSANSYYYGGGENGGGENGGDEDYAPAKRVVKKSLEMDIDAMMAPTKYGYRGLKK